MSQHEWITTFSDPVGPQLKDLEIPLRDSSYYGIENNSKASEENHEMMLCALHILWSTLFEMGILSEGQVVKLSDIEKHPFPGFYQLWFRHSLPFFEEESWISLQDDSFKVLASAENLSGLWETWKRKGVGWSLGGEPSAHVRLLGICLEALPQILRQEVTGTEVMFPAGSLELVEGIYQKNEISDLYNKAMADVVLAYLRTDPKSKGLRILEIGAGTGATTRALLDHLVPYHQSIEEYCYTDISKTFLDHGRDKFGKHDFFKTKIFDVERDALSQIESNHYHIVVASNVLHATKHIRMTIRHCKAALRNGGLLLINEISTRSLFTHLTFGLLEGWWLYEDPAIRIPGSPGLFSKSWSKVLREEGFRHTLFPAEKWHHLGQQIVVSQSDGIVRHMETVLKPTKHEPQTAGGTETSFVESTPSSKPDLDEKELALGIVKELVAKAFKMSPDEMKADTPFEVYGLDSILVVQLTNQMHDYFPNIKSTLFFEVPHLRGLVDYLLDKEYDALHKLLQHNKQASARPELAKSSRSQKGTIDQPSRHLTKARPVRKLKVPLAAHQEPSHDRRPMMGDIAVIGLSGRYPMARNSREFWNLLKEGKSCITEIPQNRWDHRSYNHYARWGGFIDDWDSFDALFFKISPAEAERMDPQERIYLESCYECIQDAGYRPSDLCDDRLVGVFAGIMNNVLPSSRHWSVANRVSYSLDFKGPSVSVDTACSSSLTAIHLAMESLMSGSCKVALAGGVNLIPGPEHYSDLTAMNMLSRGDKNRSFGDGADGFVDCEGVGGVLLKPLRQATKDRDHIYGVLKSSHINAGGKTNGYTVPNPQAQYQVIAKSPEKSNVPVQALTYLEAHGTGTSLGDPIEIEGLQRAFESLQGAEQPPEAQFCAIGSVKSNIGHAESAAGIAGLTKVLLQLKHRQLVPSLHSANLNPRIDFAKSPFKVQQILAPWHRPILNEHGKNKEHPLTAGISSFGAGGANAHLVVQEYIEKDAPFEVKGPCLVVLSAPNKAVLKRMVQDLLDFAGLEEDRPRLFHLAYTLQVGRPSYLHRFAAIVNDYEELSAALTDYCHENHDSARFLKGLAEEIEESEQDDLVDLIDSWLNEGKLLSIAKFWLRGFQIPWQEMYDLSKVRRVSLPSYPFERHIFPIPEKNPVDHPISQREDSPQKPSLERPSSSPRTDLDSVSYRCILEPEGLDAQHRMTFHEKAMIVDLSLSRSFSRLLEDAYRQHSPTSSIGPITPDQEARKRFGVNPSPDHRPPNALSLNEVLEGAQVVDAIYFYRGYVWPSTDPTDPGLSYEQALRSNETFLLKLIQEIRKHQPSSDLHLYLISSRDQDADTSDDSMVVTGSGLRGLGYAFAQSDHKIKLRNLHIDEEVDEAFIDNLLREPSDQRGRLVSYSRNRRFVEAFLPWSMNYAVERSGIRLGGCYLVAGGSGGIGQEISKYLAEQYEARIIWLGRSPRNSTKVHTAIDALGSYGRQVSYYQCDIRCLSSLRACLSEINEDLGPLHGAIYSALDFHFNQAPQSIDPEEFERLIRVKTMGSLYFYQALADLKLDFLCYFSSAQAYSFSGASQLAAYATGISYADSLVSSVSSDAVFPIGIVNWGFWQKSLDLVHQEGPSSIRGLSSKQGLRCFEAFIHGLVLRKFDQAAFVVSSPSTLKFMHRIDRDIVALEPNHMIQGPQFAQQWPAMPSFSEAQMSQVAQYHDLLLQTLSYQLSQISLDHIETKYEPWLQESHNLLKAHQVESKIDPWHRWSLMEDDLRNNPIIGGQISSAASCLRSLPDILQGKIPATEVLFPKSSTSKVASVYRGNDLADYYNAIIAQIIVSRMTEIARIRPEYKVRLLEIGAGTGGTTRKILEALSSCQHRVAEYCFTDISKGFLIEAENELKEDHPFLSFARWDVENPAAFEGFEVGKFDVVIAANVLHATSDMRRTLRHAKAALKMDGLLILNELTQKNLAMHLSFGLLDGWWKAEDKGSRIEGSPLLSLDLWKKVLKEAGFRTFSPPFEDPAAIQNILVAVSDGLVELDARSQEAIEIVESSAMSSDQTNSDQNVLPEGRSDDVVALVRSELAKSLKLSEMDIDDRKAFSDYGMDSVLSVGFMEGISQKIDSELNTALIYEYGSVKALAAYLNQAYKIEYASPLHEESQDNIDKGANQVIDGKKNESSSKDHCKIAVIGMSGQFPGAENVNEFWHNLIESHDVIEDLPSHYQNGCSSKGEKPIPGTMRGGILKNRDCFDPGFFKIAPREALSMSPHQRLILQESWKCLEDAGYDPMNLEKTKMGIYIGAEPSSYYHQSFTGASDAIIASRLSYYLDTKGPAVVVNTGCSSSASAIHLACEGLRTGSTSMSIAGGVFAALSESMLEGLAGTDMLSEKGFCATFDEAAEGTAFSEGVGSVLLKRLDDAVRDGDDIYGVISASAMNQDGFSNGITAPNGAAQEELIRDLYQNHGIDPTSISYVEAHGTATRLGDPVEVNALTRAFRSWTNQTRFCALGSVKSHIGHTSASAGVIGLIKVLLSMKHKLLPGQMHFRSLNPLIEEEESAFYVNRNHAQWKTLDGTPLRAALSSFGHSGTNIHMVIEDLERPAKEPKVEGHDGVQNFVISAQNPQSLRQMAQNLFSFTEELSEKDFIRLIYTLQVGRTSLKHRLGFRVGSLGDIKASLKLFLHGKDPQQGRPLESEKLMAWLRGEEVIWLDDWNEGGIRRLHTPTYPFKKEVFRPQATHLMSGSQALHPILHQNLSRLGECRYASKFRPSHSLIKDLLNHPFASEDRREAMVSLAIEVMSQAVKYAMGEESSSQDWQLAFEHLIWEKLEGFDFSHDVDLQVIVKPLHDSELSCSVLWGHNCHMRALVQGQVKWRRSQPQNTESKSLPSLRGARFFNREEIFDLIERSCQHSVDRQLIDCIHLSDDALLLELTLPSGYLEDAECYILHPLLCSMALQSLWLAKICFDLDGVEAFDLRRLSSMRVHGTCGGRSSVLVTLSEDLSHICSIEFYDDFRNLCHRFALAPSIAGRKDDLLTFNDLTDDAWNRLCYLPEWTQVSLEPENHCRVEAILIVYFDHPFELEKEVVDYYHSLNPRSVIQCVKIEDGVSASSGPNGGWRSDHVASDVLLKNILQEGSSFQEVIFLATQDARAKEVECNLEISFLRFTQQLRESLSQYDLIRLTILTLDCVALSEGAPNPIGAGLAGMAYTLSQDEPRMVVGVVDLSLSDLDREGRSRLIGSALGSQGLERGERLKLLGGHFYRLGFKKMDLEDDVSVNHWKGLKNGGVYLIVGGAGSVGSSLTRQMMEHQDAQVIWMGRRPRNHPKILEKMTEIESDIGRSPYYVQADVLSSQNVKEVVQKLVRDFGKIDGAIFSALVFYPEEAMLGLDERQFLETVALKTKGLVHFYEALKDHDLDFMCCFSSAQAYHFLSAKHSCAYAAAITQSDSLLDMMRLSAPFPIGRINWGYWATTTLGTDLEGRIRGHFGLIEDAEGYEVFNKFIHLLCSDKIHHVLCINAFESAQKIMNPALEVIDVPAQKEESFINEIWDETEFLNESSDGQIFS